MVSPKSVNSMDGDRFTGGSHARLHEDDSGVKFWDCTCSYNTDDGKVA
jgi:hypothetical protein